VFVYNAEIAYAMEPRDLADILQRKYDTVYQAMLEFPNKDPRCIRTITCKDIGYTWKKNPDLPGHTEVDKLWIEVRRHCIDAFEKGKHSRTPALYIIEALKKI
jgi:hypothetical protein